MKITSREKAMLIFLVAALLVGGYYYFIVDMNDLKIAELEADLAVKKQQLENVRAIEEIQESFDTQFEIVNEEIKLGVDQIIVNSNQEEIILLSREFLGDFRDQNTAVNYQEALVSGNTGTEEVDQEAQGLDYTVYSLDFDFTGDFEEFLVLLNRFWDYPKALAVDSLSMSQGEAVDEAQQLSAQLRIHFYNLFLSEDQKQKLYKWTLLGIDEDRNPFDEIPDPMGSSSYVYLGDPIDGNSVYRPLYFRDIEDHWAQNEIESSNLMDYVYGIDNDFFGPDQPITKSQFVVMLDRILKWPLPVDALDLSVYEGFEDLEGFEYEYKRALFKGYITGDSFESLGPDETLTQRQMALLFRETLNPGFSWNAMADLMAERGIASDNFVLDDTREVTRAEAIYALTYFREQ